jgi:hypothetical protein
MLDIKSVALAFVAGILATLLTGSGLWIWHQNGVISGLETDKTSLTKQLTEINQTLSIAKEDSAKKAEKAKQDIIAMRKRNDSLKEQIGGYQYDTNKSKSENGIARIRRSGI